MKIQTTEQDELGQIAFYWILQKMNLAGYRHLPNIYLLYYFTST